MKKGKKFFKLTTILLVFGLVIFSFVGCGSSSSDKNTSPNKRGFNADKMKQRYEGKLKELVSNNTITQAQSDKILNALTTGRQGNFNRRQNNGQGNNQNSNQNNTQSGTQNGSGQGNRQNFNPLSKLVEDGTITQQQADTVWQSLRGNEGNRTRSGNNSGNSGSSSSTTQQ